MNINPQVLNGQWTKGFALDLHTSSSHPIRQLITEKKIVDGVEREVQTQGEIVGWDTKRPEVAQELYRLKYWKEKNRAATIGNVAANFLRENSVSWKLDLIIPIPPSDTTRVFQPVYEIAKTIGANCNLPIDFNILKKLKPTSQLKEIEDPALRKQVLEGAFSIEPGCLKGKNILLFDDLYRSGETLNAVCTILASVGQAACIYVLTITKTRSKR